MPLSHMVAVTVDAVLDDSYTVCNIFVPTLLWANLVK